ncbi:hypothetical protein KUL67_04050, partial [Bacillus spizizenii]
LTFSFQLSSQPR